MKFTSITITTLLAVVAVEGAAIANPAPEAQSYHGFCLRPAELCSKLKRAAEAAAEAIDGPPSYHGFCYRPGELCTKAKRDALALAEATAEAFAAAAPEALPCYAPGAPCSIAKREALSLSGRAASLTASTPSGSTNGSCWHAGEPCLKLKRAAEAVAEALAQPNPDSEAESGTWNGSCWPAGEPCFKQKRALDDVSSLLDKILLR